MSEQTDARTILDADPRPSTTRVLHHDRSRRLHVTPGGNVYARVALPSTGEHPSTTMAAARRYVESVLGAPYVVRGMVGREHYRDADGYPTTARRYSVVKVGGTR